MTGEAGVVPELGRWSILTMVAPERYVDRDSFWSGFAFERWSHEDYEWTQDPWNGFRDFASRPRETVDREEGDCEDYALVALSWAVATDRQGAGLGFCWEWPYPWPRHVVAFDEERVYSSGHIAERGIEEWVEDSRFGFHVERRV